MSYIHEALIKAQKERNSNYPKDQVQVAETVRLTAKTSWLTLTLLMMLISILVAIIVYSWFKSIQNEELSSIEIVHQTKPIVVVNPEKSIVKSDEPVRKSDNKKHKIIKEKLVKIEDKPLKNKQASIKQPVIQKQSEIKQVESIPPDEIEKNSLVEKEADDYSKHIIGPGKFLEVSRLYDKGLQDQVQKKYESAITYYKKCLEISPHMAPALNNMGVILLKKNEIQQAKTYFLTAIKESPDYVDPYYNLACLFSQIKDANQAIEYLKMAVQKSPEARNWAITDQDFEPLYELKEFNMIISGY